jgi:hypothetical protein
MSEHLPGKPTMVIKMMVGGGHLVGTNWLYNVAPRDGTVLASIGEAIPLTQVLEPEQAKFDVSKFNWLGNPGLSNLVLATWADKGVKTIDDAKKKQVIIGAGGPTSPSGQMPRALNNVLGTKFKIIVGFPSTSIDLAMERGEVDGRGSAQVSYYKTVRPHWVAENKLAYLVQWGPKRDPGPARRAAVDRTRPQRGRAAGLRLVVVHSRRRPADPDHAGRAGGSSRGAEGSVRQDHAGPEFPGGSEEA